MKDTWNTGTKCYARNCYSLDIVFGVANRDEGCIWNMERKCYTRNCYSLELDPLGVFRPANLNSVVSVTKNKFVSDKTSTHLPTIETFFRLSQTHYVWGLPTSLFSPILLQCPASEQRWGNTSLLLLGFHRSPGWSDEDTLFISVAVASIWSCAQAFMVAVAICWVNLGIRQWRHLLCNNFFNCHGSLPYYLQQSRNAVFWAAKA